MAAIRDRRTRRPRGESPQPEPPARGSRRPRGRWLAATAALLALLAVLAVAWAEDDEDDADIAESVDSVAAPETGDAAGGEAAESATDGADAGARGRDDAAGAEPEGAQTGGLGELEAADADRRLIREGSMTVGYSESFDDAYHQVTTLARRRDGRVLEIDSRTDEEGTTRGSVTVEVPVGEYDGLLEAVAEVGPVLRRDVRTEDVTEEYVDLRSRLRHLERTEQFFLDLFEDAETVDEAITVRDRLDSVQERIEEIEGRLRHLEQRTEMSRLTVELVPEEEGVDEQPPVVAGFADYWHDARQAFVAVTGRLLVIAVGGAPLALVAGVALLAVVALLRAWRSRGSAGPAAAGAESASAASAE